MNGLGAKALSVALVLLVQGCATLDDCAEEGGRVLGEDVPRMRTSTMRMKLAEPAAAAARFLPYATISALAYVEERDCGHQHKISPGERSELEGYLKSAGGWERVRDIEKAGECEDDVALYYQVWRKELPEAVEVVLAFRGTWGLGDWYYGNLRWFTRFITRDDQYNRARQYSRAVLDYFKAGPGRPRDGKPVRFYSAGHSLGGGLAQAVLYDRPRDYIQAYAFTSSPVTGYMDENLDNRMAACRCLAELGAEARIYRFYESDEILSHLRFIVKMFVPPDRHIHEVRFGFQDGDYFAQHSIVSLAKNLRMMSADAAAARQPWYSGIGKGCTGRFEDAQRRSCSIPSSASNACP